MCTCCRMTMTLVFVFTDGHQTYPHKTLRKNTHTFTSVTQYNDKQTSFNVMKYTIHTFKLRVTTGESMQSLKIFNILNKLFYFFTHTLNTVSTEQ